MAGLQSKRENYRVQRQSAAWLRLALKRRRSPDRIAIDRAFTSTSGRRSRQVLHVVNWIDDCTIYNIADDARAKSRWPN